MKAKKIARHSAERKTQQRRGTMEAKVDMRRLQLLNDRIAQVMEALNQVRFSVHGLQHSVPTTTQFNPWAQQAYGLGTTGIGNTVGINPGLGYTPYQQTWVNPLLGLSHSPFEQIDPTSTARFGIDPTSTLRFGIDPFTTARVAQTFPFAYSAVAPI
jgi:hypothetical protein